MKSCKLCEVCSDGQFITETTASPDHDHEIMRKKKNINKDTLYVGFFPKEGKADRSIKVLATERDSDNQMNYLGSRVKNCPQTLDVLSSHCKIYLRGRRTPRDSDTHHVTHTAYSTSLPNMHRCQQMLN